MNQNDFSLTEIGNILFLFSCLPQLVVSTCCKGPNLPAMRFNPILVGGQIPPLVVFFNNSARQNFMAMKLLDFLQLLIVQLLKKFH